MGHKQSKIIILAVLVIIAGGLFVWNVNSKDTGQSQQTASPATVQETTATEVSYDGQASKNALQLLKDQHKVETKTYKGLGELVTSIDGVKTDKKHFWAFYVNDKQAKVGASTYVTVDSDKITWKYEEIK